MLIHGHTLLLLIYMLFSVVPIVIVDLLDNLLFRAAGKYICTFLTVGMHLTCLSCTLCRAFCTIV
jgi:hypothetical protein